MSTAVKNLRDIERKKITSEDQIPEHFASYEEETEFWETHEIAEGVFEGGPKVRADFYRKLGIPDPTKHRKKEKV